MKYNSPLEALACLGETPEAIRRSLALMGIRGRRLVCSDCPITHYLRQVWSETTWAGPTAIVSDYNEHETVFDTPPVVREFMRKFDSREFPELIEGVGK